MDVAQQSPLRSILTTRGDDRWPGDGGLEWQEDLERLGPRSSNTASRGRRRPYRRRGWWFRAASRSSASSRKVRDALHAALQVDKPIDEPSTASSRIRLAKAVGRTHRYRQQFVSGVVLVKDMSSARRSAAVVTHRRSPSGRRRRSPPSPASRITCSEPPSGRRLVAARRRSRRFARRSSLASNWYRLKSARSASAGARLLVHAQRQTSTRSNHQRADRTQCREGEMVAAMVGLAARPLERTRPSGGRNCAHTTAAVRVKGSSRSPSKGRAR